MQLSDYNTQIRNLSQTFTWAILILGAFQFLLGIGFFEQKVTESDASGYMRYHAYWGMGLLIAILGKLILLYFVEKRRLLNKSHHWFLTLSITVLFALLVILPLVGGVRFLVNEGLSSSLGLTVASWVHEERVNFLAELHTALSYALGCATIVYGLSWATNYIHSVNKELSHIVIEDPYT
ncbi:hypothetical protein [Pseudovibrio brasiliensis]|uniref:Cytochrome b561 domain-containing protein n=1 Tax=Pseudovibrio brasiliensis TaxID=1898042 RepID=A0ABX8AWQ9_9HYPH|nr:hypothetical protein [Pseudovibrio brasiliensis]QUS59130.1 hypothetical protein KGB56_26795 [Pseudovibrio brasiliensis]